MNQTTKLAQTLEVAPDTLLATLGDAATALRYDRYYSFRSPETRSGLRPVMTSTGQQRLVAFLTPDDGAVLACRGLGGSVLPMTTVDDLDLLLALLTNTMLGDLIVFEQPVPFTPPNLESVPADMSFVTRARLLTALYQRALVSLGTPQETLLYARCITWLDQQGDAGDSLLAATAFMLWRLVQGSPPSARELARIAGVDESAAAVLLARALTTVQAWYNDHANDVV